VESHPFRKVREKDGAHFGPSPLVLYSSRTVTFGLMNRAENSGAASLVIFLVQKLRPRPLGNFPQFP
jgi:hypothetical protein